MSTIGVKNGLKIYGIDRQKKVKIMPTNNKEYMRQYQNWKRNPKKHKKPTKRPLRISLSRKEVDFLRKLIVRGNARRIFSQDETIEANKILYKV